VLDSSAVADVLSKAMPTGGRPRQLPVRSVLLGFLLAFSDGRPAQLSFAWRALKKLGTKDQLRLRAATAEHSGGRTKIKPVTYRQFSDAFSVMMRAIDPSPVPVFRPGDDRSAVLARARSGVEASKARELLDQVVDALLEASVPERFKSASASLAVDWTDHETWSRPRPQGDTEPANDPDAYWGHAKRNAPGASEQLFFGYYAQVATMVGDSGGDKVPELIRRVVFASTALDPAMLMAAALFRLARSGVATGDVLADCGYSNRKAETWAAPLRTAGFSLVMDLHPNDRGTKGSFEGAVCANGQLYCPMTPEALFGHGPLKKGATKAEAEAHDTISAELARHKLGPVTKEEPDGYRRVMCPAAAGKVRCPLKAASLHLSAERPSITAVPASPPRCCAQSTITVPPHVNEKTRQRHDYASPEHRKSYARRTAAERAYASLADPSTEGVRRGWSRMFGVAKNTLVYALCVVVRNLRIADSFDRSQRAGKARPRPRRRHHQLDRSAQGAQDKVEERARGA